MDKPIPSETKKKDRFIRLIKFAGITAVFILLFFGARNLLSTEVETSSLHFAKVMRGNIQSTVTASGKVVPLYEMVLNAPIRAEIRQLVARNGQQVEKGDTLLELDASFIVLQHAQLKDQLELRKNNVALLKLQYKKELKDLEIENHMQQLKLNRLKSSLKDAQKLNAIGGTTGEEVKQAKMNVGIAKLEKQKLQEQLNYKKNALSGNLKNLELEVNIQEKKLDELARKIALSNIKPLQPGVVTWINQSLGQKVNEGDALVKIANLTHFKVEAAITDRHMNKLSTGMPLKIRVNKTLLDGHISSILPEVKHNQISFYVSIQNDSSEVLRPSMQVEIMIPTEQKENVLKVANGADFSGAREQEIFVVNGNIAEKREVKVGLSSGKYIELSGNIKEGEEVVISGSKTYAHLSSFKINK